MILIAQTEAVEITRLLTETEAAALFAIALILLMVVFGGVVWVVYLIARMVNVAMTRSSDTSKKMTETLSEINSSNVEMATSLRTMNAQIGDIQDEQRKSTDQLQTVKTITMQSREAVQSSRTDIADMHMALTAGFERTQREIGEMGDVVEAQLSPVVQALRDVQRELQEAKQQHAKRNAEIDTRYQAAVQERVENDRVYREQLAAISGTINEMNNHMQSRFGELISLWRESNVEQSPSSQT